MDIKLILTIAEISVSLGILIVAWLQINKVRHQMYSNTLLEIDRIMHECRPNWRGVYKMYRDNPKPEEWNENQQKMADTLVTTLDRIAYLTRGKYVKEKDILDLYATVFARSWVCLESYIKKQRVESKEPAEVIEGAYQRRHFEQFAVKSIDYLKNKEYKP